MFVKNQAMATVVGFLLIPSALAQTSLLWKFEKGQVYEVERITTQKQTVEMRGKIFKQDRQSSWQVRLEVKEKQADAHAIIATLAKVEQQTSGGSAAETLDPKLAEKMQGSSFKLLVTTAGKLSEIQGYEEFVTRLADKDKARLKTLRVAFPEAVLKEAFADLFGPLPDKPVAPGYAWQRTYVEPIPHFGALQTRVRYTYDGPDKKRERISYTMQSTYELPKAESMVLFRVTKGNIASEKAKGGIVFDRTAGRLVAHERSMLLRGTLTIETMDRQTPLEFTSENELNVRVKAQ